MIYQVYEQKKVDFAKKELHKSMNYESRASYLRRYLTFYACRQVHLMTEGLEWICGFKLL